MTALRVVQRAVELMPDDEAVRLVAREINMLAGGAAAAAEAAGTAHPCRLLFVWTGDACKGVSDVPGKKRRGERKPLTASCDFWGWEMLCVESRAVCCVCRR